MYWLSKDDVQIVCGCFRGNLGDFEKKVEETHAKNEKHLFEYTKFTELCKIVINY